MNFVKKFPNQKPTKKYKLHVLSCLKKRSKFYQVPKILVLNDFKKFEMNIKVTLKVVELKLNDKKLNDKIKW